MIAIPFKDWHFIVNVNPPKRITGQFSIDGHAMPVTYRLALATFQVSSNEHAVMSVIVTDFDEDGNVFFEGDGEPLCLPDCRSGKLGTLYAEVAAAKPDSDDQTKCDQISGLTIAEKRVMELLIQAYQGFIDIPRQHPDEMRDFVDGIHRIQDVMSVRVVRRHYPEYWATYSEKP